LLDEELRRVSTDFAERVSAEVTNQLLSDLLGASLNEGERDAIIQGHVIQTHRARALIDTVRKKGPEASRIMIFHLERRDSTLHGHLGLPRIPTPQAAKIPQALKQETSLN
uniref:CARD domain-containing protein n=1 Tax=Hippocampus comes TaxID=109280 RepID=A0A3Q2XEN3_HIPCM